SHRVAAALKLGEPARVIAALEASERDLPNDYNPAARLALVYGALGRYDEGIAASERALRKVSGPRRIRVLETRANLEGKKNDLVAARLTLAEALRTAQALPAAQQSQPAIVRLRNQIAQLEQREQSR